VLAGRSEHGSGYNGSTWQKYQVVRHTASRTAAHRIFENELRENDVA
jgi:hypothetical protein